MKPILVWPRSRSSRVPSSTPVVLSMSTHGCGASSSPHGRPNATKGMPMRRSSAGLLSSGVVYASIAASIRPVSNSPVSAASSSCSPEAVTSTGW